MSCSVNGSWALPRKAGGRYMDHSVVCDADLPLNMSPTVCSCPAGWTTGRLFFLQPSHGHVAQQGGVQGDLLSHWLLGWGPLFFSWKGYSPHARKTCGIPPAAPSQYIQHSAASHHPTTATQPQLLLDLTSHYPHSLPESILELFQAVLRPGLSCVIFS